MNLPNSKLNHFNLKSGVHLFKLADKTDCKYHNRIWNMRGYFLLARYMEKVMEKEKLMKGIYDILPKHFTDKVSPERMLEISSKIPFPKLKYHEPKKDKQP